MNALLYKFGQLKVTDTVRCWFVHGKTAMYTLSVTDWTQLQSQQCAGWILIKVIYYLVVILHNSSNRFSPDDWSIALACISRAIKSEKALWQPNEGTDLKAKERKTGIGSGKNLKSKTGDSFLDHDDLDDLCYHIPSYTLPCIPSTPTIPFCDLWSCWRRMQLEVSPHLEIFALTWH